MYAIVEAKGRQYKISPGDVVPLDHLNMALGDSFIFDKVLMFVSNDQKVVLDKNMLDKIKVSGVITGEKLGEKLLVFKYKRRKGYHRKRGHRQKYTLVKVESIETQE